MGYNDIASLIREHQKGPEYSVPIRQKEHYIELYSHLLYPFLSLNSKTKACELFQLPTQMTEAKPLLDELMQTYGNDAGLYVRWMHTVLHQTQINRTSKPFFDFITKYEST